MTLAGGPAHRRGLSSLRRALPRWARTCALAGLLAAAACGDDGGEAAPATTAEATTTTADPGPALRRVASIVARHRTELLDELPVFDECSVLDQPCDPRVLSDMLLATFTAETLVVRLEGADDVPAELDGLVADTLDAAGDLRRATSAYLDADCPGAPTCDASLTEARQAASRLTDLLGAWDPYL